jgi:tungstate transport system ATP-binding protein
MGVDGIIYRLSGVTKVYSGRTVLHIPQMDVHRGEFLCVLGPNGAGKSSLLRLLNFIEPPTTGRIEFDGHPVDDNIPLALRRRVTTVFQRPLLIQGTVESNVAYGLRVRGQRDQKRVREMLDLVGMTHMLRAQVKKLSGGEMQRVALARALAINPDVLLLDEPTANLDPYNTGVIERAVTELNRERGITVVMVTHNTFQARRLAHRGLLLLNGQQVEVSDAERFFESPEDPRTTAFIRGEMVY